MVGAVRPRLPRSPSNQSDTSTNSNSSGASTGTWAYAGQIATPPWNDPMMTYGIPTCPNDANPTGSCTSGSKCYVNGGNWWNSATRQNQFNYFACRNFRIGFNEMWFGVNYGTDLTTKFDLIYVNTLFAKMKQARGRIVRIGLFYNRQGINISTVTLDSRLVTNLAKVLESARANGLLVYVTGLEANLIPSAASPVRDFYWNLFNNSYGVGDKYNTSVLSPVLQLLNSNSDVIYGFDLINEIEAAVALNMFSGRDQWSGARAWIQRTTSYIKSVSPWLKVSSSAGWHTATDDIKNGRFSGIGLDFYDVHVYSDTGSVDTTGLCSRAGSDGVQIILGEFGQATQIEDDNLQSRASSGFLNAAKNSCFDAALGWRFDAQEKYLRYLRSDGSFRPAIQVFQNFQ